MNNTEIGQEGTDLRNRFVDKYIYEQMSLKGIETIPLSHIEKAYPLENYSDSPKYLEYGQNIPAYKLGLYFIEVGAHDYCQDLFRRMGERMPPNRVCDSLNVYHENFVMASHCLQFKPTRIAEDVWTECEDRNLLSFLIAESKRQFEKFDLKLPNPFEGSPTGVALYNARDFELFEKYCEGIDDQRIGSTLKNVKGLFASFEKGFIGLQCRVIGAYAANVKNLNQSAAAESISSFWSIAGKHLDEIERVGDKKLIRTMLECAKSINITSINNTRAFILSRKAFPVMSGLLHLGAIARRTGVALDEPAYKAILAPLSDIGKTSGTSWMQALDDETVAKAKQNLNILLEGFSPSEAPIGKISKGMASSLSVMTGDLNWMGKLRLVDRGQALEDQLGL